MCKAYLACTFCFRIQHIRGYQTVRVHGEVNSRMRNKVGLWSLGDEHLAHDHSKLELRRGPVIIDCGAYGLVGFISNATWNARALERAHGVGDVNDVDAAIAVNAKARYCMTLTCKLDRVAVAGIAYGVSNRIGRLCGLILSLHSARQRQDQ